MPPRKVLKIRKRRFASELAYYNNYANNKTLNIISNNAFQ